jgi:hypothetical protein
VRASAGAALVATISMLTAVLFGLVIFMVSKERAGKPIFIHLPIGISASASAGRTSTEDGVINKSAV